MAAINEAETSPSTSSEVRKSRTTIIDLNDDCLKHLFAMVNFVDLYTLARMHNRFSEAAGYVFSTDRGKHLIKLSEKSIIDYRNETIEIHTITEAGKFWYHFGSYMRKLQISLTNKHTLVALETLIIAHCRKTLLELTTFHGKNLIFQNLRKQSFQQLVKLSITGGCFNKNVSRLSMNFPSLQAINLCMVNFKRPNCIGTRMPLLNSIHYEYNGSPNQFAEPIKSNLENFLQVNRHIQHLTTSFHNLHSYFNMSLYSVIDEYLKNLKSYHFHDYTELEECELHLDSVRRFTLSLNWPKPRFIFRFQQLYEFNFIKMPQITARFIQTLCQYKSLRKISLLAGNNYFYLSSDSLGCIADLPNLNEFHVRMMSRSISQVAIETFCNRCKSLQRLHVEFNFDNSEECAEYFDMLKWHMASGWTVVEDEQKDAIGMAIFERRPNGGASYAHSNHRINPPIRTPDNKLIEKILELMNKKII